MIISKTKPSFIDERNQALVMLEDGIWRVARGRCFMDSSGERFVCNQEGYQYTLDNSSFKSLYNDAPVQDAEQAAIRFNLSFLSQKYKLSVPESVRLAKLREMELEMERQRRILRNRHRL